MASNICGLPGPTQHGDPAVGGHHLGVGPARYMPATSGETILSSPALSSSSPLLSSSSSSSTPLLLPLLRAGAWRLKKRGFTLRVDDKAGNICQDLPRGGTTARNTAPRSPRGRRRRLRCRRRRGRSRPRQRKASVVRGRRRSWNVLLVQYGHRAARTSAGLRRRRRRPRESHAARVGAAAGGRRRRRAGESLPAPSL